MKKLAIFLVLVLVLGCLPVAAAPSALELVAQVEAPLGAETGTVVFTVGANDATAAGTVIVNFDNTDLTYVSCDALTDMSSLNITGNSVKLVYSNLEAREGAIAQITLQYDCSKSDTTVLQVEAELKDQDGETANLSQSYTMKLITEADVCPSANFVDLDPNAWYHKAVDYVTSTGLMNGMTNTVFAPNGETTRAQFVTVLFRMTGADLTEWDGETDFDDVDADDWFAPYVTWAVDNGLVQGDGNGNFRPNSLISRQELVTILARLADAGEVDTDVLKDYADADHIAAWAADAMAWAVEMGIIQGYDNHLAPTSSATRAQIAQIVMNYNAN